MPRHKTRRPWIDYLVYLAVRLIVAFAQMLTISQSYALARVLSWVTYRADARHRKVGIENLRLAYGDRFDDCQRDRIVRAVYLHFCMMIMELLHIPRKIHVTNWRQFARLVGHQPILDRFMTGGPMILLTGHYGNWELAGYLFGLFGYPTYSVARTLDNPYLDRFLAHSESGQAKSSFPSREGTTRFSRCSSLARHCRCWRTRTPEDAECSWTSSAGRPRRTRPSRCWQLNIRRPSSSGWLDVSAPVFATKSAAPRSFNPKSSPTPPTTRGS